MSQAVTPAIYTVGVGNLAENDFPPELRPIIIAINNAVGAARVIRDRSQNSPDFFRAPATEAFLKIRQAQALLGGSGRELISQLSDWKELGQDPAQVSAMLEEFQGTIDYLLSEAETPRPTTAPGALLARQNEVTQIVAVGQARAQAALAVTTSAILRLPQAWLGAQLNTHYPQQFRQITPENPVGCWFQSFANNHRTEYQQKNWSRTQAPPGAQGPWVQPGGVIGCQPRWHIISVFLHHQNGAGLIRANSIPIRGQKTYDVSHLCHYRGCANPAHLVLEDHDDNQARNSCQGRVAYNVTAQGGMVTINPCTHRATTKAGKECILPVVKITSAGRYEGLPPGQRGAGEA